MVFSFIGAMHQTALKSTPTTTSTKLGMQQDKEIQKFDSKVGSEV